MYVRFSLCRALIALGALSVAVGCTDTATDVGHPLSITLTVDRSSGRAGVDAFSFQYRATGTDLLGVVLEFGDGQVDSLSAQGASSAGATRSHVYETVGVFTASARAHEATGAVIADSVVVEIVSP